MFRLSGAGWGFWAVGSGAGRLRRRVRACRVRVGRPGWLRPVLSRPGGCVRACHVWVDASGSAASGWRCPGPQSGGRVWGGCVRGLSPFGRGAWAVTSGVGRLRCRVRARRVRVGASGAAVSWSSRAGRRVRAPRAGWASGAAASGPVLLGWPRPGQPCPSRHRRVAAPVPVTPSAASPVPVGPPPGRSAGKPSLRARARSAHGPPELPRGSGSRPPACRPAAPPGPAPRPPKAPDRPP